MDPGISVIAAVPSHDSLPRLLRAVWLGWAAFLLLNATAGSRPRTVALDAVVVVVGLACEAGSRRWPARWSVFLHGAATASTMGLSLASGWSGGVDAIAWWYLAAVPLFVSHAGGQRLGIVWAGIAAAACLAGITNPLGLVTEFVPSPIDRAFGGVVLIGICTTFGWLARAAVDERIERLAAEARIRSELLAAISHEIRTPLHGILGVAAILGESPLSSDQRELVAALRGSGKALNRIVDDVLDVSRLESGKVEILPAPVDLMTVLEDVVDLHAADASAKGLQLVLIVEGAEHLRVEADETRVTQIVSNLVSNAVKFTSDGSIVVRATAKRDGDRMAIEIRVEDTGPGIPADQLGRLFRAFERLDTKLARLHGGSGLGLALARDLAVRMGGGLEAERDRPVGACLVLTLHLPAAAIPRDPPFEAMVLVVEASRLQAAAARSVARALGSGVLVVDSVAQAEALLETTRVDSIVLGASSEIDLDRAHTVLAAAASPGTPIVLALPTSQISVRSPTVSRFDGTTMRPLRRSRARGLAEAAPVAGPVPTTVGRRTALVVDDDPGNRRILARLLGNRGWHTVLADSGPAALEALARHFFDVVLCDLHMPGMAGTELVERAREQGYPSFYVAATASVLEADRERCRTAGFEGFLRKPFEPAELDELLGAAVRRARKSSSTHSSVAPPATEVALLDPVRWPATQQLFGRELAIVLAEHFEHARGQVATIRRDAGDPARVGRAAHAIASGALMLGLNAYGEAARRLELDAGTLDEPARRAAGEALLALLEASEQVTRTALAPPSPEHAPAMVAGIASVRFAGHLDAATAERLLDAAMEGVSGVTAMLVDCREMTGYEPSARRVFERWHREKVGSLAGVAVLTDNALWHGVIAAIALVTGQRMRAFDDETEARTWLMAG